VTKEAATLAVDQRPAGAREERRTRLALRGRPRAVLAYAGIIAFGVLSYFVVMGVNAFYSQILIEVLVWTAAATGVNVTSGLGGSATLMQGAFYGLGAYGSAILLAHSVPFLVTIPIVSAAAAVVALVIGVLFTRTRGQYFAVGTLFLGAVFTVVLDNWGSMTGGTHGLSVPADLSIEQSVVVICAVLTIALCVFRWIQHSRLGQRLTCLRDDEDLSAHLGVPTARVKVIGFAISAVLGAAAGAAYSQFYGSVTPGLFTYLVGFLMYVAVGVGGPGRLFGPLLGCALIKGLPPALNIGSGLTLLVVGVIFVIVTITMNQGLMGVIDVVPALVRRIRRRT
jgi:branched-chain amino acid transport system permease protein